MTTKITTLLLALAFAACSGHSKPNNAGASSGGSTGSTSGSSGGASSGSSSGGLGGSSSGGAPPAFTRLSVINAAPHYSVSRATTALDVCVKASSDSDFGASGIAGGVSYANGSTFTDVAPVASTLRIVAADSGCASGLVADQTVDFSAGGFFTAVISGDGAGVSKIILLNGQLPAAGKANLSVAQAIVGKDAVTVTSPLPYEVLATGLGSQSGSSNHDLAPPSGRLLKIDDGASPLYFKDYSAPIAAGAVLSVVLMGDASEVGALAPSLLVGGVGADGLSASYTTVAATANAVAYVRAANLVDAGDAAGQGTQVCVTAGAAASGAAITWSDLLGAEVSNFVIVDAGVQSVVTFAATDCGTPLAGTATVTFTPTADTYYTAALGGDATNLYSASAAALTTNPVAAAPATVDISIADAAEKVGGAVYASAHFSFPQHFDFALGTVSAGDITSTTIAADVLPNLDGDILSINSGTLGADEADFLFQSPSEVGGFYTAIVTGDTNDYSVLWCDNIAGSCAAL